MDRVELGDKGLEGDEPQRAADGATLREAIGGREEGRDEAVDADS